MARRKGAYSILKGMDMSVPGAVSDADATEIPDFQQNDTPVKVSSSIRLQPVDSSSGVQFQPSPAQQSSKVSSKKITKISVQHQSADQNQSPQVQQFQQTYQQSAQKGTPIQIQRQTAVQQRKTQLQSNPKARQGPQQQQPQQQQQPSTATIRLQQPSQSPANQGTGSGYHSVNFNPKTTSQFSSNEPQQYNQQSTPGYQKPTAYQPQDYNQKPSAQFSPYQPQQVNESQWNQNAFQPSKPPPSEIQQEPDDFEFPPVSQLSRRFQEKPEPTSAPQTDQGQSSKPGSLWARPSSPSPKPTSTWQAPSSPSSKPASTWQAPSSPSSKPASTWQAPSSPSPKPASTWQAPSSPSPKPATTWQTPSSPRAGRRQFPVNTAQQVSAPSFGTQYTKPSTTASSPKVIRKLPQQPPQPAPTFGSQYSLPDSDKEPLWEPAPSKWDPQAPKLEPTYNITKSTISAEERQRWEPKSVNKLPTNKRIDQAPVAWQPPKPPAASSGQKRQEPKHEPVSDGLFGSPKPSPIQKPKRPKSQPEATSVPSFGTEFERRSSGGGTRPPKPPSQPQPAVPSFGTQYGDPPTGSVILPKRQPAREESPSFGTQYTKPTPQPPTQQPTPPTYSQQSAQKPTPSYSPGAPRSAQEPTIPSFGAQYTPTTKPSQKPVAKQAQRQPVGTPQRQVSDLATEYGVVFTPKDEEQIREEVERKRRQLEQQEASTCPWTVDDIKNRVSKLRADLFSAKDENQELLEEMRKLNNILNELKVQYEYSEKQKQALEYKTGELSDEIHDLKSQQTTLKMDLEQTQMENDRLTRDLERAIVAGDALHDSNAANTRMKMELGHVQGEHSRVQMEMGRITADKTDLENNLKEANASYNQMKRELDLMNDSIVGLQKSLVSAEAERSMLWDRLVRNQREKEQMMEELMLSAEESF